ncbi:MAG: hypothetical protein QW073_03745 [Desulfurococcaceae archaeon]
MFIRKSGIAVPFILLSTMFSWFVSFLLHDPLTPSFMNNYGFKYSDIIYGVLNPRFNPANIEAKTYWYRFDKLQIMWRGGSTTIYPYVDFKLEYPPLIGLMYFVSINLAYKAVAHCGGLTNYTCYREFLYINYLVHSLIILVFHVSTASLLIRVFKEERKSFSRIPIYIFTPSMLIYMIYNWDLICSFFTILSVYLYIRNKIRSSALTLSLAILTKLVPILITITLVAIHILKFITRRIEWNELKQFIYKYLITNIIIVTIPLIILYIANPNALIDFYKHHRYWYCENCIYQVFERNLFSEKHVIYALTTLALTLTCITIIFSYNKTLVKDDIWKLFFIITVSFISLSYISSPQMILLATPFLPLIMDNIVTKIYLKADLLNALGILFFFKDAELRECLVKLGFNVKIEYNPWSIPSPTQLLFLTRSFLLLAIVVYVTISMIRENMLLEKIVVIIKNKLSMHKVRE